MVLLWFLLLTPWGLAAEEDVADAPAFVQVSIAYPQGETMEYRDLDLITARYQDDKTPIALSRYYDGYLWATVPADYAQRPIEGFIGQKQTFTDDTDDAFEFYLMEELTPSGVIQGDAQGRALPYATICRSEAVVMIMRMLGLPAAENSANGGYQDVPEDAWYASWVAAAQQWGIVAADDRFYPQRQVSREEFIVMLARGLWLAGMRNQPEETDIDELMQQLSLEDAAAISSWARPAYASLNSYILTFAMDMEESGQGDAYRQLYYAKPQQPALRYQAASLIWRCMEAFQVYPSQLAVEYGFDQAMPVIDGSTSTYPYTQAVYNQLFRSGDNHLDKPAAHSKSHASYERLIAGEVDMLFASVYPASDIVALAKEQGVELELIPIAYDAMIFFTNADNPAVGLTSQQIHNIYVNDAYDNWQQIGGPDALLYPYCRNNDSGSHAQMERHFLNGQEINERIRQETTSVSMANVLTDVMGAQTSQPLGYALGYSIYYYFYNMDMFYDTVDNLKLLAIDGVYPNEETIADGSYPLANYNYIVLRKDTPKDAPSRKMVEFMLSAAGQACVENAGFGPLNRP